MLSGWIPGFAASSGILTTPLGIEMALPGVKGFCSLICNSLRRKFKLGNLQFVGEINPVEERI